MTHHQQGRDKQGFGRMLEDLWRNAGSKLYTQPHRSLQRETAGGYDNATEHVPGQATDRELLGQEKWECFLL